MRGSASVAGFLLTASLLAACGSSSARGSGNSSRDILLPRDATVLEAVVPQNATLEGLLRQQLSADLTRSVVEAAASVFNPRRLRADRSYQIRHGLDGLFREFRYEIDADNLLRVVFRRHPGDTGASFDAEVVPVLKEYVPAAARVGISPERSSLIDAFGAKGENIQLTLAVADVFAGEVDFNSDLRLGDQVQVLFDRALRGGEFVGYGEVKAAVLKVGDRTITAVRYDGADGKPGYYDDAGRSMRRQFLRSPLPFSPRVTSGFSNNRYHPVHGTRRPHLGVDYRAPSGTAVNAVAKGVVEAAQWAGDAGRMVRIRHTGGYQTAYLHLSSFGPGMRPGVRVEQGQLIGRVGRSGSATGPHLDYRVMKNGVYLNPLTALSRMPQGDPIPPDEMPDFQRHRDLVLSQMQEYLLPPSEVPALVAVAR